MEKDELTESNKLVAQHVLQFFVLREDVSKFTEKHFKKN